MVPRYATSEAREDFGPAVFVEKNVVPCLSLTLSLDLLLVRYKMYTDELMQSPP